jgi:hypothetical protein
LSLSIAKEELVMLVRTGVARYRHDSGDDYSYEVTVQGTGESIIAVLGNRPIAVPGPITHADYHDFEPAYITNIAVRFSVDAEPDAAYEITLRDGNGGFVDSIPVTLLPGDELPEVVPVALRFKVNA